MLKTLRSSRHLWLQSTCQFRGMPGEDPNEHIRNFLEVCDTFKMQGMSEDAARLKLFPFSLKDAAKEWLGSLPTNSISTWAEMTSAFLTKYFPPGKAVKLRNDILSFQQYEQEPLHESWERYKKMLKKFPQQGIPHWIQITTFYNVLSTPMKNVIDAAAGGALMNKSEVEAEALIEDMASNNNQWPSERNMPKKAGLYEVDASTHVAAQLSAMQNQMAKMEARNEALYSTMSKMVKPVMSCELCKGEHTTDECFLSHEAVQYVKHNNMGSTYNPGWKVNQLSLAGEALTENNSATLN